MMAGPLLTNAAAGTAGAAESAAGAGAFAFDATSNVAGAGRGGGVCARIPLKAAGAKRIRIRRQQPACANAKRGLLSERTFIFDPHQQIGSAKEPYLKSPRKLFLVSMRQT